jgi:hypothetical protein
MYENDGTYAGVLLKSYELKGIKSIEYDPSNHGRMEMAEMMNHGAKLSEMQASQR